MTTLSKRQRLWVFLAIVYVVLRFAFTRQLEVINPYTSYIMEFVFVLIAASFSGGTFSSRFSLSRVTGVAFVVSLAAGFLIFRAAAALEIAVPFDLSGSETIFFLLVVAPVLEELIFRFFLWEPLEALIKKPWVVWVVTSVVFSYSHLHSIWFVPDEIYPFIEYQTAYTFLLGLGCGYFVYRYHSIAGAIAVHFAFNLGFYLAA